MNLLIIEDDKRVSSFLSRGLKAEGYGTLVTSTAEEGLHLLRQPDHGIALVLLDVMLPGVSGIEACQQLRAERIQTPVLMLTAMGAVQDRVTGLRCGADDYLTKPFAFDELLARIEALLRRPVFQVSHRPDLTVADLRFDRSAMQVYRAGVVISLTAKELALLELLMSAPDRLFSRERILSNVWGLAEDPLTNVVDVYIRRLRNKVDEARDVPLIKTVRGLGYKLSDAQNQ